MVLACMCQSLPFVSLKREALQQARTSEAEAQETWQVWEAGCGEPAEGNGWGLLRFLMRF